MLRRLALGIVLLITGFVFGWQMRAELAARDCERAGGTWAEPGICAGVH